MNSRRFRNSSFGVTSDSRMSAGLLINIGSPLALHAPRGTHPGTRHEHPARGTRHEARGTFYSRVSSAHAECDDCSPFVADFTRIASTHRYGAGVSPHARPGSHAH